MDNIAGFHKQVSKDSKGNAVEKLISNYDKSIVITAQMSEQEKKKAIELSDLKGKQGFTSPTVGLQVNTLQSPNDQWIVTESAYAYKVPQTPKGKPERKTSGGITRMSTVLGQLVFVRYGDGFKRFLKMTKNAPYNFIDAEEAKAVPYHSYILKNKGSYASSPKLIAWAEAVHNGKTTSAAPLATVAKPSEVKSSFDSSVIDNMGADMLDSGLVNRFKTGQPKLNRLRAISNRLEKQKHSNFMSGEMPDKFGGDFNFSGGASVQDFNGGDIGVDGKKEGGFFKNLFGKKSLSESDAKKLADKDKVVYTEAEMKQMYETSGSKKPFAEWAKSDTAKAFMASLKNLGAEFLLKKAKELEGSGDSGSDSKNSGPKAPGAKPSKKILGMHPVTFGIVAVGVLGAVIGGAILYKRSLATVSVKA